jgi:hypothetical protein
MMSAARVTQLAPQSLMIRWHPADCADVTGPGTAISGLPRVAACRAVFSAPLRSPASTTTVPQPSAAMTRLRTRNRVPAGRHPGGHSLTTRPWPAIAANRSAFPAG